ncbi:hemagglutinin repeat-containing protein [Pseudomonas sp. NPDC007930]|uniref:hemagglutinin repeat-containing protein n=1 Tax=Pseudomonas sp. NPDC007930 TaxID=3364417 RepID=UPI0036F037FA
MKKPTPFPSRRKAEPLRYAIAAVLLLPTAAGANGIVPAAGPGGTPLVNAHNGVPVIDIVAPVNGLSHNQFGEYNVGQAGAVLNNSLNAGQSALAGPLNGNSQFNGVAAGTILNEVVGGGLSRINGPQEIFGQAANYVLANPNGIQINGGQLINAPHSAFLVGRPELTDGRISGLNTFDAHGQLEVGRAGLISDGALDLIAPKVDALGQLVVPEGQGLNVISGRNRVALGGEVLETRDGELEHGIDTQLLGGMRAGRIRVISTAAGAGVRMADADFIASQGLEVRSQGNLQIGSTAHTTRLSAARGDIELHAQGDMQITNTRAGARNINGRAEGDLNIAPGQRSSADYDETENSTRKFLGIVTERRLGGRDTKKTEHSQSVLTAEQNLSLSAGRHLDAKAADMQAQGHASLEAGGDLTLGAAVDRTEVTDDNFHRKHLWSSKTVTTKTSERNVGTQVKGQTVSLRSGGDTTVRGSQVTSDQGMTIEARNLTVTGQATVQGSQYEDVRGDYLGGLVTKGNERRNGQETLQVGSTIKAGGTLKASVGQARIEGSQVHGEQGATLVSEQGALAIESSHNLKQSEHERSSGSVFGLVGKSSSGNSNASQAQKSEVSSASNLAVAAATDLRVTGSDVSAGGTLQAKAQGDVIVEAALNTETATTHTTERGFIARAGQTQNAEDNKPDSLQYQARVGLEHTHKTTDSQGETLRPSQLQGQAVAIEASGTARLDSSQVNASAGDVTVNAPKIELASSTAHSRERSDTATSGGGIGVTGGMDRSGSESWGEHKREVVDRQRGSAGQTEITSSGATRLIAGGGRGEINNQGARIKAGGETRMEAATVNNEAVHDTESTTTTRHTYAGSAGLNIETKFITRPIQKMIEGQDQTIFQKGVEEAMAAPSLGVDVVGGHTQRVASDSQSTAKASHIEGAQVNLQVEHTLKDEGTAYKANAGTVAINAGSHDARAAHNRHSQRVERLDAEGAVRVDTVTSVDVNARAVGTGSSLGESKNSSTALPTSLEGKQGIAIQLGTDGRYEGTAFDSGEGITSINAGGSVEMPQANNAQQETRQAIDGFAWVGVGTGPDKARNLAGGGAASIDQHTLAASQGVAASLNGKGARVSVKGDFSSQGLAAGSLAKPLEVLEVNAGGTAHLGATVDTREKTGQRLGGGLQLGMAGATGARGGGLGGHIDVGRTNEQLRQENTSAVHAEQFKVTAGASGPAAVQLTGVAASGQALELAAPHGGVLVEAATRTEHKGNVEITAGLSANTMRTGASATDTSGLHARARVKVDSLDSTTYSNAQANVDTLALNSADNTHLNGVQAKARQINGEVGGDLIVSTRQDHVSGTEVSLDGRISREHNPQGLLNAVTSVAGPWGGKVQAKAGKDIRAVDPNTSPGLTLNVVRTDRTTAAQQSELRARDGIDLAVQGSTQLNGALVKASQGAVNLGEGAVNTQALNGRDYRADVGINASNSPTELATSLVNELTTSRSPEAIADQHTNTGVLRIGGHDKTQQLEAKVEQKRL